MKEKFMREAFDNYKKMISRFDKLELIELKDENTDDANIARKKEAERILIADMRDRGPRDFAHNPPQHKCKKPSPQRGPQKPPRK